MGWLSQSEIQMANSYDGWNIKASWLGAHGITLGAGKYYQIKFVAGGSPWIEMLQFIKVNACSDALAFRVNGNSGVTVGGVSWPRITIPSAPLTPGPASSHSPLVPEAAGVVSCSGTINLTLQRCSASGTTLYGSQISANFSASALTSLDLFTWAQNLGIVIQEGIYYKIRLRNATSLAEVVKQIQVTDCTPAIAFAVNDSYASNVAIMPHLHRAKLSITDFQPTCFLHNALFHVSMETSDQWGSGQGDEITEWMGYDDVWHLDLRAFAEEHDLELIDGNYYKVAVSGDNNGTIPWMGTGKIIQLPACTNDPDFTINNQSQTGLTPVVVTTGERIRLSAWNSVNCDGRYYISIKKTNAANVMVPGYPEIAEWLPYDYAYYMGSGRLNEADGFPGGDLGYFNLVEYAQAKRAASPWPGASQTWPEGAAPTLGTPAYYWVSLCTDGGQGFMCRQMMIKLTGIPIKSFGVDAEGAPVVVSNAGTALKLFTEDAAALEQVLRSMPGWDERQAQVLDLQGRVIGAISQGRIEWTGGMQIAAGVYIIR